MLEALAQARNTEGYFVPASETLRVPGLNRKGDEERLAVVSPSVWRSQEAAERMWFLTWVFENEWEFPRQRGGRKA